MGSNLRLKSFIKIVYNRKKDLRTDCSELSDAANTFKCGFRKPTGRQWLSFVWRLLLVQDKHVGVSAVDVFFMCVCVFYLITLLLKAIAE